MTRPRPSGGLRTDPRRPSAAGGRWRRAAVAVAVAAAVAGALLVAVRQPGFAAQSVDLGSGSVWLSSTGPGQLALLDGASAEITVRVAVAAAGDDVMAVQSADAGYAVNRTQGTVTRVDAATWRYAAARPLPDATAGLSAVASPRALYVLDLIRGAITRADPRTMTPTSEPRSLSAIRGAEEPLVDDLGVLWLLDPGSHQVFRMDEEPEPVGEPIAAGPGAQLVLADQHPVVVDPAGGTAIPLDPATGRPTGENACVDNDPGDTTVRVTGSTSRPEIYTVSGQDGVLRTTDLATGQCHTLISIGPAGSAFGDPVEAARRVYVPDFGTGKVVIVDLDRGTSLSTEQVTDPGHPFDLIGRDGFIFYNDRTTNNAGVVQTDGVVRAAAKYDLSDPAKGVFQPSPEPGESPTTPAAPSTTEGAPPPSAAAETTDTVAAAPDQATPPSAEAAATPAVPPSTPPPPETTVAPPTSSAPATSDPPAATTVLSEPAPPSAPTTAPPLSAEPPPTSTPDTSPPTTPPTTSDTTPTTTPAPQVTLTVSVMGNGSLRDAANGIDCPGTCSATLAPGTSVVLVPQGIGTVGWTGACSGSGATCPLTITGATTAGVTFTAPRLTITVEGLGGRVTNSATANQQSGPGQQTIDFPTGGSVTLTAVNDQPKDWIFTGWTGACSGSVVQCTISMDAARSVTATFTAGSQDCISYNTANLSIVDQGASGWLLTDGASAMNTLDNQADAQAALTVARNFTHQCFIGRDNQRGAERKKYIVQFWEGGTGQAPAFAGQDCIPYSPANLTVVDTGADGWSLRDGSNWLEILDNSADAQAALAVARQRNNLCFQGRSNPRADRMSYIFEYWR